MEPLSNLSDDERKALTSIHSAYTLAATDGNADEVDEIIVKHFLDTLAEVAMVVASRKPGQEAVD